MPYKPNLRQPYPNELYHHGIKGQKWGVRRFQNADGSYTPAGKKRYSGETGIKGLFSKKKKKTEPEKKTLGISEEEKAFTETVKKAGFREDDVYDRPGRRSVTFSKTGFNKNDPFLKISIDYDSDKTAFKSSDPHKALQKANRFAKNSDKIVSRALDKIVEDDDHYKWLVQDYKWKYPDKPVPSKKEMKAFLIPLDIDARRNQITIAEDIGPGWFTVEFNKDTYEPYRAGFDD